MQTDFQFMVDFNLPEEIGPDFMDLLPEQRAVVDDYLADGRLVNYALSLERAKLWAIFTASSEVEVIEMLLDFPLTPYLEMEISLLTYYNTNEQALPAFSPN